MISHAIPDELQEEFEAWADLTGDPSRKVLWIVGVLLLVFFLEQLFSNQLGYNNPFEMLSSADGAAAYLRSFLAPLLHSNPAHLTSNLVTFILPGYLFARRTRRIVFYGYILIVGLATSTLAPVLGVLLGLEPGFAIGFSGVTFALTIQESIFSIVVLAHRRFQPRWLLVVVPILLFLAAANISSLNSPPPGVSVSAHILGVLLGFGYVLYESLFCNPIS